MPTLVAGVPELVTEMGALEGRWLLGRPCTREVERPADHAGERAGALGCPCWGAGTPGPPVDSPDLAASRGLRPPGTEEAWILQLPGSLRQEAAQESQAGRAGPRERKVGRTADPRGPGLSQGGTLEDPELRRLSWNSTDCAAPWPRALWPVEESLPSGLRIGLLMSCPPPCHRPDTSQERRSRRTENDPRAL